ncbi:putative membrane protein [Pontibacter aydingkolensis]|uniref:DUF2798 domain-containing protein n=1 Tax=Pontibacter aydingkolensis TaxID=1911536 RepID=A0ABS7CPM5_9BACT|nr:DUF2798 domain-containing protein [Pontibacter aydingkolensis]MBW7465780.1 DUF2798 domain-containing protein [Pontibacter aydingkolensis]
MRKYIKPQLKRKVIIIAIISLLLASALELYTFGANSDFLMRWFRSFFVIFTMVSLTVLVIVPAINYAVNKAAGK